MKAESLPISSLQAGSSSTFSMFGNKCPAFLSRGILLDGHGIAIALKSVRARQ
jgi:hypothetical protein